MYIQLKRKDIVGYTGEGEPPCIVMTLKAVSSGITPPNLEFTVTLKGIGKSNNQLELKRTAENPDG